ncbi:unnamed protein product [Aphanomyces euteiches]
MAGLPPSPAFQNPALAHDRHLNPPAVQPGAVVLVAIDARRALKTLSISKVSRQSITDDKLGMAMCRETDAVAQINGGAMVAPLIAQAIDAGLAPVLAQLRAVLGVMQNLDTSVQGVQANVQGVHAQTQGLRADVQGVHAQIQGLQAGVQDLQAATSTALAFQPPTKFNAGFMVRLPLGAMGDIQGIPDDIAPAFANRPPAPGPDVFPPPTLPFLENNSDNLTIREIGYLCRWYNDGFAITPNDRHENLCNIVPLLLVQQAGNNGKSTLIHLHRTNDIAEVISHFKVFLRDFVTKLSAEDKHWAAHAQYN